MEIRQLMDKIQKTPLMFKSPLIEKVAEKQYELMAMFIVEINKK